MQQPLVVEYRFEAPQAGEYTLAAQVVTVHSDQMFVVQVNDGEKVVEMPLPFTNGYWKQTRPVAVNLAEGENVLRFTRPAPGRGVTIREIAFTPAS